MVLRCCVYSRVFSWRKTWTALRSFLLLPRRAIEKSANMITWFSHHRNFPHFLHNFQARFLAFIFLLLPFFLRTIANCAPQVRCTVVSYILKIDDDGSHWESMVSSKICWAQGSTIWRYYGELFVSLHHVGWFSLSLPQWSKIFQLRRAGLRRKDIMNSRWVGINGITEHVNRKNKVQRGGNSRDVQGKCHGKCLGCTILGYTYAV